MVYFFTNNYRYVSINLAVKDLFLIEIGGFHYERITRNYER